MDSLCPPPSASTTSGAPEACPHFGEPSQATDVFICGLATNHCIKLTALDAARMGFKTHFIEDASCKVNLQPNDVTNAIDEMNRTGIVTVQSIELMK